MNPWLILAAVLACAGSFWYGTEVGADGQIAKQATTEKLIREVTEAANTGAAQAIANNKPKNTTIVQKATHEIQTNTVYRDCLNTPGQLRNINDALTGKAQPAGDSKLPGAVSAK